MWSPKLLLPRFFSCYFYSSYLPRQPNNSKIKLVLGLDIHSRHVARLMMSSRVKNLIQCLHQKVTNGQESIVVELIQRVITKQTSLNTQLLFAFFLLNCITSLPVPFCLPFFFFWNPSPPYWVVELAVGDEREIVITKSPFQKHVFQKNFVSSR